jgi:CHASE2 domain-containing sensor protein
MAAQTWARQTMGLARLKWIYTISLILAALSLQCLDGLKSCDNYFYDSELALLSRPPAKNIVITAIDDYSLEKLGKWPEPLVELLTAADVKNRHRYSVCRTGLG